MDLRDTPEEAAFRSEVQAWLEANLTDELRIRPRWYNAVTTNCTTSIRAQRPTDERMPWDWRILVNGKGMGETSLLVFYGNKVERFDLVVHPAPLFSPRSALVPADAHSVEVLRAGRSSHELFVRDAAEAWVPLGNGKMESEAPKK